MSKDIFNPFDDPKENIKYDNYMRDRVNRNNYDEDSDDDEDDWELDEINE